VRAVVQDPSPEESQIDRGEHASKQQRRLCITTQASRRHRIQAPTHTQPMRFSDGVLDVVMIFLTLALCVLCTGT
jgi:hypothetical protein